jgi:hypothetical protein
LKSLPPYATEYRFRFEYDIGPLHHTYRLKPDHINDHLKISPVIPQIAIKFYQRHEVDDVQRIGCIKIGIEVQPETESMAAASAERDHQNRPGPAVHG